MSKIVAYRTAVLACILMSFSARTHNQIALVLACWIVLGLVHDKVVDRAIQVHARKWNKILWMVVSSQKAQTKPKPLEAWLASDLTKKR